MTGLQIRWGIAQTFVLKVPTCFGLSCVCVCVCVQIAHSYCFVCLNDCSIWRHTWVLMGLELNENCTIKPGFKSLYWHCDLWKYKVETDLKMITATRKNQVTNTIWLSAFGSREGEILIQSQLFVLFCFLKGKLKSALFHWARFPLTKSWPCLLLHFERKCIIVIL